MGSWFEPVVTIAMGVIMLAVVATLVGQHAQTAGVIGAAASGFGSDITAAEGPVLSNS